MAGIKAASPRGKKVLWSLDYFGKRSSDAQGNEDFLVITFKVPTGANKGAEPYDGYEMAKDYVHNLAEKERKAEERKAEKARKIAKDKEIREAKAKATDK